MQGEAWVGLFQRIPTGYQDNLYLVTTTGCEIIVQSIVCLEPDYVVLRGRSSGSTETGRVYILPYDQIDHAGFTRRITEPEVKVIFGDAPPAVAAPALPAAEQTASPVVEPEPAASAAPAPPAAKKPLLSKSILLSRLRARLGSESKPAQ